MASSNEITGARQVTKALTPEYSEGWDRIFGEKSNPENNDIVIEDKKECSSDNRGCCGECC